jgi:hypothetical protein
MFAPITRYANVINSEFKLFDVERRNSGRLEVFEELLIVFSLYRVEGIVYKVIEVACGLPQMQDDDDDEDNDDEFENTASFYTGFCVNEKGR